MLTIMSFASADIEMAGNSGGVRGLVQGNNQEPCPSIGCHWGLDGGTYVKSLWVTHPNVYWRCQEPGVIALTFDDG